MKYFSFLISLALLSGLAVAQTQDLPANQKDAITRAELVVDLDRYLADWEVRNAQFATRDEVAELRALIVKLRDELDLLGGREGTLEGRVERLERRTENTGRPGF
ncbi:MAG: hypothetical protein WC314_17580 [Vulcanimicrobiota bacterium]